MNLKCKYNKENLSRLHFLSKSFKNKTKNDHDSIFFLRELKVLQSNLLYKY